MVTHIGDPLRLKVQKKNFANKRLKKINLSCNMTRSFALTITHLYCKKKKLVGL